MQLSEVRERDKEPAGGPTCWEAASLAVGRLVRKHRSALSVGEFVLPSRPQVAARLSKTGGVGALSGPMAAPRRRPKVC